MKTESSHNATSYTITCRMNHEAAALERLCQVVRIRGFRIAKMAVETADGALDIALTIQGSRPVAMLQSQLEKLHTVAEVKLAAPVVAAASRIA
ncbi:ACT domain-containing protein [Marinobacter sp. S6332]|uniref:ACT domain-containing protein n=1 Tax=Marinobacter sp. S6332 TaxID=2926403 RepID=UPI001FF5EB59|nr:ACT domain-containing protein [Marinobacter sp. S6332]MCK0164395.1 ACT domain-containing protein [Marinobacter sp. S6332]